MSAVEVTDTALSVVESDDPEAWPKLVDKLLLQGIEVHRTSEEMVVDGRFYDAGSWVVPTAQPKRGVIRWLLGRTFYLDNHFTRNDDGSPIHPYDLSTHTMYEFMGVRVDPVETQVEAPTRVVSGQLDPAVPWHQALRNAFPPGSMTGAPKVMSMQMIDRYEPHARGAYAGSAGYFTPSNEFDLNVIIRSLLYRADQHKLSYHVGGAITYDSDPAAEYEETLVKARGIRALFEQHGRQG